MMSKKEAHLLARQKAEQDRIEKRDAEKQEKRQERNKAQALIEADYWQEINNRADQALEDYKKRRGRPVSIIISAEIKENIIDALSNGQPLTKICERQDYPTPSQVYCELRRDPLFFQDYLRARENLSHVLLYDTLVIADDASADTIKDTETGEIQVNRAKIERDKLKIDTRLRVAGKINKDYSDRAPPSAIAENVTVNNNTLTISGRDLSPDDRQRLRDMLLLARGGQARVIEN